MVLIMFFQATLGSAPYDAGTTETASLRGTLGKVSLSVSFQCATICCPDSHSNPRSTSHSSHLQASKTSFSADNSRTRDISQSCQLSSISLSERGNHSCSDRRLGESSWATSTRENLSLEELHLLIQDSLAFEFGIGFRKATMLPCGVVQNR